MLALPDMAFNPGVVFGNPADRMFIRNHHPLTLMAYVTLEPGLEWCGQLLCGELAGGASIVPRLAVPDVGLAFVFSQAMLELQEQAAAANSQDLSWEDRIAVIGVTHTRTFNNFRGHLYEVRLSLTASPCISGDNYANLGLRAGSIVAINVAGVIMIRMPEDFGAVVLARNLCGMCNEPDATQQCSRCHLARYCSGRCQRLHWSVHRYACNVGNSSLTNINALDRVQENA